MGDNTKIEWSDATWNFAGGCEKVSAGCKNCYAIKDAHRLAENPNEKVSAKYKGTTKAEKTKKEIRLNWTNRVNIDLEMLKKPLTWTRPRKIFVNSMSDLFHPDVPDEVLDQAFAVMALTPHHTYQLLTKRAERMAKYIYDIQWQTREIDIMNHARAFDHKKAQELKMLERIEWNKFSIDNLWLGVSVEDQKAANERIPYLLETPVAVRFLSCEPLLGEVSLENVKGLSGQFGCGMKHHGNGLTDCPREPHHHHDERCKSPIDQVIVGGESGPGARPMHPEWARRLRNECARLGASFFFKQWGNWAPVSEMTEEEIDACYFPLKAKQSPDETRREKIRSIVLQRDGSQKVEFPDGAMQMFNVGKKDAGRTLDGRTWDEFPK